MAIAIPTAAARPSRAYRPPTASASWIAEPGTGPAGPVAAIPPVQCKPSSGSRARGTALARPGSSARRTAMPDALLFGIEVLSGVDMSGVRVHTGVREAGPPERPRLYTRERHLSRSRPRETSATRGVARRAAATGACGADDVGARAPINADAGLEREADVMGARASRLGPHQATAEAKRNAPGGAPARGRPSSSGSSASRSNRHPDHRAARQGLCKAPVEVHRPHAQDVGGHRARRRHQG